MLTSEVIRNSDVGGKVRGPNVSNQNFIFGLAHYHGYNIVIDVIMFDDVIDELHLNSNSETAN